MKFFSCLFFLFLTILSFGQLFSERNNLIKEFHNLKYIDSEKALKIADYLKKNAINDELRSESLNFQSEIYYLQGNYELSVEKSFEAKRLAESAKSNSNLGISYLQISLNCLQIGLLEKAEEFLAEAESLLTTESIPLLNTVKLKLYLEKADSTEILKKFEQFKTNNSPNSLEELHLAKAMHWKNSANFDSSTHYYLKIKENSDSYFYRKSVLGLAEILSEQKNSQKALEIVQPIQEEVIRSNDWEIKANLYEILSETNFELNSMEDYRFYVQELEKTKELLQKSENGAQVLLAEKIDKEYESQLLIKKNQNRNYLLFSFVVMLILCALGLFVSKTLQYRLAANKAIIKKIDQKNLEISTELVESKSNPISQKTEQLLLTKLSKFEESEEFLNQDISLQTLSKQLDTNRKYLSEIINKHKEKNFNAYINELRIKYIIEKLKTNSAYLNYKISYLAEECGFSSHSVFASVFKSVAGISPTTFIKFLQKEQLKK